MSDLYLCRACLVTALAAYLALFSISVCERTWAYGRETWGCLHASAYEEQEQKRRESWGTDGVEEEKRRKCCASAVSVSLSLSSCQESALCPSFFFFLCSFCQEEGIDLYSTISILGYGLLPVVFIALFSLFMNLKTSFFGLSISILAVLWCTATASRFFESVSFFSSFCPSP